MIASEEQRRALLAGLLDTDGTVASSGAVLFDNTNPVLARQVHELACSLGYRATIREGRARLDGCDYGPRWTVSFTTSDQVFRLERKRLAHKDRSVRANSERTKHRYIVDVRPVPSVPVRCLTVDSPNRLYLVGKTFIPTHNTVIINGIVMEAAARGWPVWICDPKRVEFMGLRSWPNVQLVASTVEDQIAVIYRAWEEMEKRYALVETGHADEGDFEPLILVLDEYRDFVGTVTEWYGRVKVRGMPSKCPVFEKVTSLARKGRTARIHVVLGTQRPDSEFLGGGSGGGGEMRDNFATRISLGRLSPQGAMMMWEAAYIGVSVPRGVPGRGTAVSDDDRPVEVQGYWTPDPRRAARAADADDLAILQRLRPARTSHPALQVQLPEDLLHPVDDEPRLWEAVMAAELVEAPALPSDPETDRPGGPAELLALTTAPPMPAPPASAERASGADTSAAPEPDRDDDPSADQLELDDEYGPEEEVGVDRLTQGDLVLVEDATHLWAVVESVEPDLDDDTLICIDWRADDDESGSLSMPDDSLITSRRPLEQDLTG
jgi:hypothetical protein